MQPFRSLEMISQPFRNCKMSVRGFQMALMCQKVVSQLKGDFAAVSQLRNEGNCAAKWHSCAKSWFRSCETPFQMASRLRNSRSTLRACPQKTITSSFHLQIAYRLKRWTPDFPSFERRYSMYNLSSRKCSKIVSNNSKMEVRHFRSWFVQSSSNGHNFFVLTPTRAPFEALDS